jgi:putative transposase
MLVCRYVERNPLRANLVSKAESWPYGSLFRWNQTSEPEPRVLSPWPIARLPNWSHRVNEPLSERELSALRTCVNRGRPFGDEQWTKKVAARYGLWHTLRPTGRPSKKVPKANNITPVPLSSSSPFLLQPPQQFASGLDFRLVPAWR